MILHGKIPLFPPLDDEIGFRRLSDPLDRWMGIPSIMGVVQTRNGNFENLKALI